MEYQNNPICSNFQISSSRDYTIHTNYVKSKPEENRIQTNRRISSKLTICKTSLFASLYRMHFFRYKLNDNHSAWNEFLVEDSLEVGRATLLRGLSLGYSRDTRVVY